MQFISFFLACQHLELSCLISSGVPYLQRVIKSKHIDSVEDKESATDTGPVLKLPKDSIAQADFGLIICPLLLSWDQVFQVLDCLIKEYFA